MSNIFHIFTIFLVFGCSSATTKTSNIQDNSKPSSTKVNGVSFVASGDSINISNVLPVVQLNANYAAIMPFGFTRNLDDPNLQFNSKRQWFGETEAGIAQYRKKLQDGNIKCMLKPQIWVSRGEFTGDIKMNSEEDWKTFETNYSNFILLYAQQAENLDIEMLCIGTELKAFVEARPLYWKELIVKIKDVYSGQITYAANWDEYKRLIFWDELDYIGVDAYFPVSDKKTPTVAECRAGWQPHKAEMKAVSEKFDKPILFTEYGYCSSDYAGKTPWNPSNNTVNLEAQSNTTQALFEEFWNEDWFAGGFIWKWFHRPNSGGEDNHRFTPQNKPVEEIIRNQYKAKAR
jgi:hypothetical protein